MSKSHRIAGALALVASLATPLAAAAATDVERKFEGLVLRTQVTLCQFKPRGCAGYMDVETRRAGRSERWTVQVRLGVPIRRGEDYVFLASLGGSAISVTYVRERDAIVARAIEVIDAKSVEVIGPRTH
ncbi:MAG: hypothetical protein EPN19_14095 [Betaproteobacteria bacterium]|nr:MAG: hypothetical protein EPN19_14095 [Betaproteobacteria bacterium]